MFYLSRKYPENIFYVYYQQLLLFYSLSSLITNLQALLYRRKRVLPYNKEKSENVATSYERFQDRTICGRFQNNMCPNYLRQKVFPAELFYARRKISRFKPLCFVGYTNYHSRREKVLKRKRNGNTSVYRVLIRGETEISSG